MIAKTSVAIIDYVKKFEHVIWDWNGTLLDDTQVCIDSIAPLLQEHGLPVPTVKEYRDLFSFPVINYYKQLGFDFNKTPFVDLADLFIAAYSKNAEHAKLFGGTEDILKKISELNISQSILSAASQKHLHEIVDSYNLTDYFENIYGIDDHFAGGKIQRGKDLIRNSNINPEKTIMIGDTDHDLEVGQTLGVSVLLVADGHQSFNRLDSISDLVLKTRFL
ncbi:MAG: HAD hydrolase-like protein [Bacteriovoracaceae bacterium]|nr:HAD hydrolase-like protein [Bacteriovoracaceae bacterium]